MEEKDPIESKFKSSFSDYEKEPPAKVWENLSRELHPEPTPGNFWTHISPFTLLTQKPLGFYLTLGGIALSLFITTVYFGIRGRHTIRGHAYAGEVRLRHGSAELFQVTDNVMPWDSATHYRSAIIDNYGHFQFTKVRAGKYLLRITPEENSETAKKFLPSWFDQHEKSDSCNLIILQTADLYTDVHLVAKSEEIK
jgi:hypothetical protein